MRSHGPWQIITTRQLYKDRFINVNVDDVVRPDGQPGTYSTVNIKAGVDVIAIDADAYAYLTVQFRYAIGRESIEVVSGGVEADEEPLAAAQRELKEELGIEARDWQTLGRIDVDTSLINCPGHLFLAQGLTFGDTAHEGSEIIKPMRVKFSQAVEMVLRSQITHAPSCALILKAYYYLNP